MDDTFIFGIGAALSVSIAIALAWLRAGAAARAPARVARKVAAELEAVGIASRPVGRRRFR